MVSVQILIGTTLALQLLCWCFSIGAMDGANWSEWVPPSKTGMLGGPPVYKFGLSHLVQSRAGALDIVKTYAEEADVIHINKCGMCIHLDYADLTDGGRATTAFMVLGFIFLSLGFVLHLSIWPLRKLQNFHKFALPCTFLSSLFFMMAVTLWSSLGHRAAAHAIVDTETLEPNMAFGWCWNLGLTCAVFCGFATILSWQAQKAADPQGGAETYANNSSSWPGAVPEANSSNFQYNNNAGYQQHGDDADL